MHFLFKHKKKNNTKMSMQTNSGCLFYSDDDSKLNQVSQTKYEICIFQDINKIKQIFMNTNQGKKYTIIKTIYEKCNKGTYIIKSNAKNIKYILKIRHASFSNTFEKDICTILKNNMHKNIIKSKSFHECEDFYYFIYEYFDGMNLREYIKLKKRLTENEIKNICFQITSGINFLHSYNIIHCDLKLDNLIINDNEELKIIDFDLSLICNNEDGYVANGIFGTMQYIAPESYDLCIYSKKTDIWQFGIILYIRRTNHTPHKNKITLVNSFSNLCRQNIFKHIDLSIPKKIISEYGFNESLFELLEKMLNFSDSGRYDISHIQNSEWFKT